MGALRSMWQRVRQTDRVRVSGKSHTFNSFACAIHVLAPTCAHCGVRIIGHGVEATGKMYCCAKCARHKGVDELVDRA